MPILGHLLAFPHLLITLQAAASPAWPRHPKLQLVRTPGGWVMQVGRHQKILFPPQPQCALPTAVLRDNFRLQPGDLVTTAGQALELDCVPPLGYPEPYITWKKDGVTLDLVGGRYVVTKGKLQVASAQRSDSGLYVCVATNAAGKRESRGARVSVLGKPRVSHRRWAHHTQPWCNVPAVPLQRSQALCATQAMPRRWLAAPWSWAAAPEVTRHRRCSGTKSTETCPGAGRWWQGGEMSHPWRGVRLMESW